MTWGKRKDDDEEERETESRLVVLGLTSLEQVRSNYGGRWRTCVSWLSHTSTNTTSLSKATDYFSHMLLQRWEAKIRRKESSPQLGIELTTTRSWVWHAYHWATRAGLERRERDREGEGEGGKNEGTIELTSVRMAGWEDLDMEMIREIEK